MTHNAIKVIIGLGNPGSQYTYTRHNIGFLILDTLAEKHHASWQKKADREIAEITINDHKVMLIKPETFMNNSGKIMPSLLKQGIKTENILVVHDELEKSLGKIEFRGGGSHRGHNGLRSIIQFCGQDFMRLRFGIGRPENKEDVAQYVLSNFPESKDELQKLIDKSVEMIVSIF